MTRWAEDLIFLSENEFGFDPNVLGFPSISGCRAITYHTENGIFGFHQATGPHRDKLDRFGTKFANFVNSLDPGRGIALYCAAKIAAGGAYDVDDGIGHHLAEMRAIAQALNFHGAMRSYDLSHRWANTGVYVEVRTVADRCDMFGNAWVEYHDDSHKAAFDIHRADVHKHSYPPRDNFTNPTRVFIKVDTTDQIEIPPMWIGNS